MYICLMSLGYRAMSGAAWLYGKLLFTFIRNYQKWLDHPASLPEMHRSSICFTFLTVLDFHRLFHSSHTNGASL